MALCGWDGEAGLQLEGSAFQQGTALLRLASMRNELTEEGGGTHA